MQRPELFTLISFLIVAVVIVFRLSRPMRLTASRLWIGPAILIVLTAFLVWGSIEAHASATAIGVALILGAMFGVPFGLLRGRHSQVRKTDNPKVLLVEPSLLPLLIWLAAFGLRFAIRTFVPQAGPSALAASDAFLAFAVASVIAARYVIAEKFKALHAV